MRQISFGFIRTAAAWLGLLATMFHAASTMAGDQELFILWGLHGKWDGQLEVLNGTLQRTLPYSFEEQYGDRLLLASATNVSWLSGVTQQFDGLHLFVEGGPDTTFCVRTPYGERKLRLADFAPDKDTEIPFREGKQFVVIGRGDPARGPKNPSPFPLPRIYEPPRPVEPVSMPEGWWRNPQPLRVTLDGSVPSTPVVRRVSNGDGRLYLEISTGSGGMGGASFLYGPTNLGRREARGALWVSLEPRIGRLDIDITAPRSGSGNTSFHLSAPATLIETRKTKLCVNGEPFLVKGALPRDLNDADAAYLKALGANTLRGWVEPEMAAKFGFMLLAMVGNGPSHICNKPLDEAGFNKQTEQYVTRMQEKSAAAVSSEHLLIAQLANEQGGGQDPWSGRYGMSYNGRLDSLLARAYNQVKPLCPMIPCGYSNNMPGYRAPRFLEVYEHNTYLAEDHRAGVWPPIETFALWQGADPAGGYRPWIMSEWGANVYMPEAYRFGPLLPVLEKIHAWNYPNRWKSYLAAGVNGGTCYCLYDYDIESAKKQVTGEWDKGFSRFGVMTFERQPKLALWELWHLWRDFEIEPAADGARVKVRYLREYSARDCRLSIESAHSKLTLDLPDFTGPEQREISISTLPAEFRWRLDFSTHGGLPMSATGAWPRFVEAEDFLKRLRPRDTYPFLRELFDAAVMSADGRVDVKTLAEMRRADGVVPVVFKKPNGVAYVTIFHRVRPKNGWYHDGVSVDLSLSGTVCAVDELTGNPTNRSVESETTAMGIRLKNLRIPFWPAGYTSRATEKIEFPVYRITPQKRKP